MLVKRKLLTAGEESHALNAWVTGAGSRSWMLLHRRGAASGVAAAGADAPAWEHVRRRVHSSGGCRAEVLVEVVRCAEGHVLQLLV